MTYFDEEAATWDDNPERIERARAVAEGIRARVPLSPEMTALEYGCGTGLLSFALQPYLGQITLVDSSTGMLAVLDEKIRAAGFTNMASLKADFLADPLPPVKVQLIYTLMTLHHILDTDKILAAFYSLLEPRGVLCVVDLDLEDGSFHEREFVGYKGFDRAELGQRARRVGFHEVEFTTVHNSTRVVEVETKHFPHFLMVAKK